MSLRPGYYLKAPFTWQPGCPMPGDAAKLRFRPAPDDWLYEALADVLATSLDPADQRAVALYGRWAAATIMLADADKHSEHRPEWWRLAENAAGNAVGFVLASLFARQGDRPRDGTIYYLGVLPAHLGHGGGRLLLDEATRTLVGIGAGRILCDTALSNAPMIAAFRQAGYVEREPWERPLR